jgi:hypothetical protein
MVNRGNKVKIQPIGNSPTFGYKNILKTEFLKGHFKTVQYGFYGDKLTCKNVTLEHLKPKSKGGKSELFNFVLASKAKNMNRANYDIKNFVKKDTIAQYLAQFIGLKTEKFNGDKYIKMILKTLKNLGVDLWT